MQTQIGLNITEFTKLYNQYAQRVLDDTYRVLSSFPSLIPHSDTYFTNEGEEERLLCLTGTVPITFRGVKYNIPILVWVPKFYPSKAPRCFVTPTRDMVIKLNHKHVDANGECSIPYIQFWNTSSNLFELVAEMCSVFSKEPPLFAKSASQPTTTHATFRNSKPLPPTPAPGTPPPHNPPAHYTPPSYTPTTQLSPASVRLTPTPITQTPPHTPPPPAISQQQQLEAQKQELQRQVTRKIQQKLEDFFKTTTKDMDMFMSNQSTLELRNSELAKSIEALKIEEGELDKATTAAVAKNEEMNNWITFMEQPRDIEELILPSDPISQQQFSVVSEDHSIDDLLYYLAKALGYGKIDLDTYLKEVRTLSRQQFFLRAMAMKLSAMQEERKR